MGDTQLVTAARDEADVLSRMMQLYAYDFSAMVGADLDATGAFAMRDVVRFWDEDHYRPLFIREDGALAGFAIVSEKSRLWPEQTAWDMAEFFVLRKYRRTGVGARAASMIFAQYPGRWEVRQITANVEAIAFWRAVIGTITGGRFDEVNVADERWNGPVQIFASVGARTSS